jgi:hypothetical protein
MPVIESLPPRQTLNGKFDAYCAICWNPVYALWISDEDPRGVCPFGAAKATDCPDAMAAARNTAMIRAAIAKAGGAL